MIEEEAEVEVHPPVVVITTITITVTTIDARADRAVVVARGLEVAVVIGIRMQVHTISRISSRHHTTLEWRAVSRIKTEDVF